MAQRAVYGLLGLALGAAVGVIGAKAWVIPGAASLTDADRFRYLPVIVIASLAVLSFVGGLVYYAKEQFDPTIPRELRLGDSLSPRYHAGVYLYFGLTAFFSILLMLLALAQMTTLKEKPNATSPVPAAQAGAELKIENGSAVQSGVPANGEAKRGPASTPTAGKKAGLPCTTAPAGQE